MIIQGQVGPIATAQSIGVGSQAPLRLGNLGDTIVSELHGRYYESNYRRNVMFGAITGQVTTVGLATTYTGLCLSNNPGNTVNLVILKVGFAFTVVFPAVAAVGLMTGYNAGTIVTHTTPVTPRSNFIGVGATGVGTLDSSCTLPTAPVLNTILAGGETGATTTIPYLPAFYDLEGSIILPPGAYCAFYTSTVSGAAGGHFSVSWEEVPI
jgi:hypothetical protein